MGVYKNFSENQFWPTPDSLAKKMAEKIDVKENYGRITILEPEAGDGALIKAIGERGHYDFTPKVDFIEIDENLRQITKYRFSYGRELELYEEEKKCNLVYDAQTGSRVEPYEGADLDREKVKAELDILHQLQEVYCVGDDFLRFETYKQYDYIIMNPPFRDGARHLLKAISMQKKHGGKIIALLNAETIRKPYSFERKLLAKELNPDGEANVEIEYLSHAFSEAERKTDVEVALIYMAFSKPEKKSFIFENLQKAATAEQKERPNFVSKGGSTIDMMIEQYNFEVQATLNLVNEYEAMKPYINNTCEFIEESKYTHAIISLRVGDEHFSLDRYLKAVRRKYWNGFFHNPQFTGMLTSNLAKDFREAVNDMENYDFNYFNIEQVLNTLNSKLSAGYEDTILALFDKLSCLHSYSGEPEEQNIHYFNGWKTNKAWKINDKKVIIPCYAFDGYYRRFNPNAAYSLLGDIEKTLNYLDNGETIEPSFSMPDILGSYRDYERANNLPLKYFDVTFYKKGTCHIKWKNKRLLEKLNIYGSQKKAWLPPAYGTKKYEDMSAEEKTIIDEFQGKEAYDKVMADKEYYLSTSPSNILQIAGNAQSL